MTEKIVLDAPLPAATEWRVNRLEIRVSHRAVRVEIVADNGQTRAYEFNASTAPDFDAAANAINTHDGSKVPLNEWILAQLQSRDADLAGTIVQE